MVLDRKMFVLPVGAFMGEGRLETDGDIILSDRTTVRADISTPARVFIGERAKVYGNITAGEEIRVDRWTYIEGNVSCEGSVYLGDRVRIRGKLTAGRDLDIGSNVEIEEYDAHGWINIRSPISMIFYIIIYLLDLIRRGRGEEVDAILDELEAIEEEEKIIVSPNFFFLPDGSYLNINDIYIKGKTRIGDESRVRMNIRSEEAVVTGENSDIVGNIISREDISIAPESHILGNIEAKGVVHVYEDAEVLGDIAASRVEIDSSAHIVGTIIAPKGVRLITPESRTIEERLRRYRSGIGTIEDLLE